MSASYKLKPFKLDLGLKSTHVLITGAAGFIGRQTVAAFLSAGANVTCFDINEEGLEQLVKEHEKYIHHTEGASELNCIAVDITSESAVKKAFSKAVRRFSTVQCCVALASLDLSVLEPRQSLLEMPYDQWRDTFEVNVHGTFLTARQWLRGISEDERALDNVSLIIVGSESGTFGEREHPDYASTKSAIQGGLLQSLKADVPRIRAGARVNAIAPGPVDTPRFQKECSRNRDQLWLDAQATTALGEPVPIESVARCIVFLASEAYSGNVHGQVLNVDSGKQGKVMWMRGEIK